MPGSSVPVVSVVVVPTAIPSRRDSQASLGPAAGVIPITLAIPAPNPAPAPTPLSPTSAASSGSGSGDGFSGKEPVITNVSGSGTPGFLDGSCMTCEWHHPNSLGFDKAGRLVVVDRFNFRIRRIGGGYCTTVAGDGESANPPIDTEKADESQLGAPTALAIDPVTDAIVFCDGDLIRSISATGQLTTLAGQGKKGWLDGFGPRTKFSNPSGLAVRADGKQIAVADTSNNRIRVMDRDDKQNGWVVSTLAGTGEKGSRSGLANTSQFSMPISVAYDGRGHLVVVECAGSRIRIIKDGVVSTLAGADTPGFLDGPALHARFSSPHHLAIDTASDTVYVADTDNRRIRRIRNGVVTTLCGGGDSEHNSFASPMGLAILPNGSGLAVADSVQQKIRFVSLDGKSFPTSAVGDAPAPKLPPNYKALTIKLQAENAALKAEIAKLREACKCGAAAGVYTAVAPQTGAKPTTAPAPTAAAK